MDAPNRYSGEGHFNLNEPRGNKEFKIVNESASVKRRAQAERLAHEIHPDRICVECVKSHKTDYLQTREWRHVKDSEGRIVKRDVDGKEIWLCNKHGLQQDRAINKAKAAADKSLDTKKRMSVEAVMNAPQSDEVHHVQKKASLDSWLDEKREDKK